MLGWHISVYRQSDGSRLAVWQAGWHGLQWIDALVEAGDAVSLGGDGYPFRYTATAATLQPILIDGPPNARKAWVSEPGDILTENWAGATVLDHAALAQCAPDEELLLEAWDES